MSDASLLLLILLGIYLWDCIVVLPRTAVAFHRLFGRGYRRLAGDQLFGSDRIGLLLAFPLPPLGSVHVASAWPCAIAPEGMAADGVLHPLAALGGVWRAGSDVLLDGRRLLRLPSPAAAEELTSLLVELSSVPAEDREAHIATRLSARFDGERVRDKLASWQRSDRRLRVLASLVFMHLIVATPCLLWRFGMAPVWGPLLSTLLLVLVPLLVAFSRAHRGLYGERPGDRRVALLAMILSPPAAVRAPDALARELMTGEDPLAVARALLPEARFLAVARETLLGLRFPLPGAPSSAEVERVESWYRGRYLASLEQYLRDLGVDPDALCAPPPADGGDAQAYCPRCRAQYTIAAGACATCALALVPLGR